MASQPQAFTATALAVTAMGALAIGALAVGRHLTATVSRALTWR